MAIRMTQAADRLAAEAVLMTLAIRERLNRDPSIAEDRKVGPAPDTGIMAAQLASTIISTFGGGVLGSTLFEETEDHDAPPANMTAA